MRILFLSLGGRDEACSRTRIFALLPFLRRERIGHRVIRFAGDWPRPAGPVGAWSRERQRERLNTVVKGLRLAQAAPRFELVVVQRVLFPVALQRLIRARSRRLLFDFDDAMDQPPHLAAEPSLQAREAARFASMLARCDGAIASTPGLAARARPHAPRVWTILTPVDAERYRPAAPLPGAGAASAGTGYRPATPGVGAGMPAVGAPPCSAHHPRGAGVVLGWIGSPATGGYLDGIRAPLARVLAAHPAARLDVIGAPGALAGLDRVTHLPWSYETEVEQLQRFDIGLMPLPDDGWTRGKGGYKLLQYMAVGAACVASPVGANAELVCADENGLLARDEAAWEAALSRLIEDQALRRRLGATGRQMVERNYALRVLAPRFVEAFRTVAGGTM